MIDSIKGVFLLYYSYSQIQYGNIDVGKSKIFDMRNSKKHDMLVQFNEICPDYYFLYPTHRKCKLMVFNMHVPNCVICST